MKVKLSVSMDKELAQEAEKKVAEGSFRNKSHIVEYALKTFLRKEKKIVNQKKLEKFI